MIIIYGSGFIGGHITAELQKVGMHFMVSKTRVYDYNAVKEEIQVYNPTAIINAAGLATPTNIDFYEDQIPQLLMTNTVGNVMLAALCEEFNIHYVTIMSGCIFDSQKRVYSDLASPNFTGSAYSKNRVETEALLKNFRNTCIVRIRMPISSDFHPKSLITKLASFDSITNLRNSVTVLDDCIPMIVRIILKRHTGIVNLVNNGTVTNAYICFLYRKMVNHSKTFKLANPEQLHTVPRSNCILAPSRFVKDLPDAATSIIKIIKGLKRVTDVYC